MIVATVGPPRQFGQLIHPLGQRAGRHNGADVFARIMISHDGMGCIRARIGFGGCASRRAIAP